MFSPQKVRQGVRTPVEQAGNEQGEPNTIRRIAPIQMLAIEYFDKVGQKHELAVIVMGGRVFVPPSAEQWLFECKAATPWLEKAALAALDKVGEKPPAIPTQDEVDVFSPDAPTGSEG